MKHCIKISQTTSKVAPRAGAWIETHKPPAFFYRDQSPPVRGRGLKPDVEKLVGVDLGRPPCGGVD